METLSQTTSGTDRKNSDSSVGPSEKSSNRDTMYSTEGENTNLESSSTESIDELVEDVVKEWVSDLSYQVKNVDFSTFQRKRLVDLLSKRLQKRLADARDYYIEELEEEVIGLRREVEDFQSSGYESVKNDLHHTENVLKRLLYIHNDGEPLQLQKSAITEMEDVILDFNDLGDEIVILTDEQVD